LALQFLENASSLVMPNSAKTKPPAKAEPDAEPLSLVGCLVRIVITLVVLAVILWMTVFFGLRTPVLQGVVCDRITSSTGMDCSLSGAALVFPLTLRMHDVALTEKGAPDSFLQVSLVDLAWVSLRGRRSLLDKPIVTLRQAEDQTWHPQCLSVLRAVHSHERKALGAAIRVIGTTHRMTVRGAQVRWVFENGTIHAGLRDLDFHAQPVRIPDRVMQYGEVRYSYAGATDAGEGDVRNAFAWLSTDTIDYIEIPVNN
jgi:hypothetical protein